MSQQESTLQRLQKYINNIKIKSQTGINQWQMSYNIPKPFSETA